MSLALGLPLGNNLESAFWDLVVDKVHKKLASWKKGFFSKAGRLTLVKSVLNGILVYVFSLSETSGEVCKGLERCG